MIKLLDLKNSVLEDMRTIKYNSFIELTADEIESLLSPKRKFYPGFYSMLKQLFLIND